MNRLHITLAAAALFIGATPAPAHEPPIDTWVVSAPGNVPSDLAVELAELHGAIAKAKEDGIRIGGGPVDLLVTLQILTEALINIDNRLTQIEKRRR